MLVDLIREITYLRAGHNVDDGDYEFPLNPHDPNPLEMLTKVSFVRGMQMVPEILQSYVNGWNNFAALWIRYGPGLFPIDVLLKSDRLLLELCHVIKKQPIALPNLTELNILERLLRDNFRLRLELPLPTPRQKHISNFIRDLLLVRRTIVKDEEVEDNTTRMDEDELSFLSELARREDYPIQMCRIPAQMASYARGWNDNVLKRSTEYMFIPSALPAMHQPYDILTGSNYKPWSAFEDQKCNGTPERKFSEKQKDDCTLLSEVILGMLVLRQDMNESTQLYPDLMTYELSHLCYLTRSAQPKILRRVPLLYASYIRGWNDCTHENEPLHMTKPNTPLYPTMVVTEQGTTIHADIGLVLLANGSAEKANRFETDDITGYETVDTNWNVPGVVKSKKTEGAYGREMEKVSGHAKKEDSRYAIGEASKYTTGEASGYTTGEASGHATKGASRYAAEGASGCATEGASGYETEGRYGYEIEGATGEQAAWVSEDETAVRNGESEGGMEREEEPTGRRYESGCRRLKNRLKRRRIIEMNKASNNQSNWTSSSVP